VIMNMAMVPELLLDILTLVAQTGSSTPLGMTISQRIEAPLSLEELNDPKYEGTYEGRTLRQILSDQLHLVDKHNPGYLEILKSELEGYDLS